MPEATLKHVRGMAHASAVPVLDPAELSESVFIGEYVAKSRPCLIKGAAGHWSALKKWRDREYLKNRSGHHNVFLYPHEYRITRERMGAEKRIVKFAEAIDYLHSEEADVAMVVTGLPVELQADTGGFPFLTRTELAFSYSPIRFFFYKNAGTTWHYHPFDETLMCHIVGTKQVGLLDANSPFHIALRTFFFRIFRSKSQI